MTQRDEAHKEVGLRQGYAIGKRGSSGAWKIQDFSSEPTQASSARPVVGMLLIRTYDSRTNE